MDATILILEKYEWKVGRQNVGGGKMVELNTADVRNDRRASQRILQDQV